MNKKSPGEKKNSRPDACDPNSIIRKYHRIFPSIPPEQWELVHLIFHNQLSVNGDVKRTIEVCLESKIENLRELVWRILLPRPQQRKAYGLSVHNGRGEILEHNTKYYKMKDDGDEENEEEPDYAIVTIIFPPLKEGEKITIKLEYFIGKYAHKTKTTLLKTKWKYPWSFRVTSKTRKFEHRIVLPMNCKLITNETTTNIPTVSLNFSYGEREMTIWMANNPPPGDLSGAAIYSQEHRYAPMVISLVASVFIGVAAGLVMSWTTGFSWLVTLGVVLVSFVGVLGTLILTRKLMT